MPIHTTCPACGATYTLRDDLAGKSVRCRECQDTFAVPGEEALDVQLAGSQIQSSPRPLPVAAPRAAEPVRRRDNDREDKRPARKEPSSVWIVLLIVGGAVAFLLVGCCGVVGYTVYRIRKAGQEIVAAAQNMPPPPVPAPGGGFPFPREPANVDEALDDLRGNDAGRRREAATWLGRQPPDPLRQAEVARALTPMLTGEPLGREPAARALVVWATPESVPDLVAAVRQNDRGTRGPAMEALGRHKDERGAAPVAALLPDFFERGNAARALQAMGPVAEKAVLPYFNHPDGGARAEARNLLKGYVTRDDVVLTQCVADLASPDGARRQGAAEWLAQARPDDKRRAEVARALGAAVRAPDGAAREPALKALVAWATKDTVPILIEALNDPSPWQRREVIAALGRLGDERAAAPLADRLASPGDSRAARDALMALGPKAEKEVARLAFHPNPRTRREAVALLKAFGTKDDVILGQALAALKEQGGPRRDAAEWLAQAAVVEGRRDEVARTLGPLLVDPDHNVAAAAMKAVLGWGTKENVPVLVGLVADPAFNIHANAMRHQAIAALGKLKDERGIPPIARLLGNPFNSRQAHDALVAMGPMTEKYLVGLLGDGDRNLVKGVCRVLAEVGTKKGSAPALTELIKRSGPAQRDVAQEAEAALKAVNARPEPKP